MATIAKSDLLNLPGHDAPPAPSLGIRERFAELARHKGESPAIGGVDRPWLNHGQLSNGIGQYGEALLAAGIGRGDVVLIALANGPEALTAILGVASVAIAFPVDPQEPVEALEPLLQRLSVTAVLYDGDRQSGLRTLAQTHGLRQLPITIDLKSPAGVWQSADWSPTEHRVIASQVDDAAILIRTSGTTAEPKIVAWSQASVLLSADVAGDWMGLTAGDRSLCVMPFSHLHSVVRSTLPGLLRGGSAFCAPGFDRFRVLPWLQAHQPTYMTAVSGIFRVMLQQIAETGWQPENLSLRLLASGSDSIDVETVKALHHTFKVAVREFYGLSEVAPMLAGTPMGKLAQQNHGQLGFGLEPWQIACLDDEGKAMAPGQEGEISAQGGLINPTLERMLDRAWFSEETWFRTGDLGCFDEEGCLRVTGRVDQRINRGGQKVSPQAVEVTLKQHPQIEQAAVFPLPDEILGQRVAAAVVATKAASVPERELRVHVARRHPDYMVPDRIFFLDALPENRAGKLDRPALSNQFAQEISQSTVAKERRGLPPRDMEIIVDKLYQEILQQTDIDLNTDFMDLGGDSFQATLLLTKIEERLGILLTPAQFLQQSSITALAKLLEQPSILANLSPITTLQEGDQDCPLFIVHTVFGYAWYADVIARYLPETQTVYTLLWQAPAAEQSHYDALETYANQFVDAIIERVPQGPFALVGHSFGAQFAFELGQQLIERGREPAFLGLMDDEADLHKRRFGVQQEQPTSPLVIDQCSHLLHAYVPQAYPASVTLFVADIQDSDVLADPNLGWQDLVLEPLERLAVPGDHVSMLSEALCAQWIGQLGATLHQSKARWLENQGDTQRITQLLVRRDSHRQQADVVALTKARIAAKKGDRSEEIHCYEQAITIEPEQSYWVYRNLAQAYWEQGQQEAAITALHQAIKREVIALKSYGLLTKWLKALGRRNECQQYLDIAVQTAPTTVNVQYPLAQLMVEHGRWHQAELSLRRVIESAPTHPEALILFSRLMVQQGNYQAALSAVTQLRQGFPHDNQWVWEQAKLSFQCGNVALGDTAAWTFIERNPASLELQLEAARLLLQYGSLNTTVQAYRHILNRLPQAPDRSKILSKFWQDRLPRFTRHWLNQEPLINRQLKLITFLAEHSSLLRWSLSLRRSWLRLRIVTSPRALSPMGPKV